MWKGGTLCCQATQDGTLSYPVYTSYRTNPLNCPPASKARHNPLTNSSACGATCAWQPSKAKVHAVTEQAHAQTRDGTLGGHVAMLQDCAAYTTKSYMRHAGSSLPARVPVSVSCAHLQWFIMTTNKVHNEQDLHAHSPRPLASQEQNMGSVGAGPDAMYIQHVIATGCSLKCAKHDARFCSADCIP